jgi:hypothetical protein
VGTAAGPWGLDYCARLGQGHHRRARPAERGGGRRGRYSSGEAASPTGQKTVEEVGMEVHGGGGALKLAGGGLIPGAPRAGRHGDPAGRWLLGAARHSAKTGSDF